MQFLRAMSLILSQAPPQAAVEKPVPQDGIVSRYFGMNAHGLGRTHGRLVLLVHNGAGADIV